MIFIIIVLSIIAIWIFLGFVTSIDYVFSKEIKLIVKELLERTKNKEIKWKQNFGDYKTKYKGIDITINKNLNYIISINFKLFSANFPFNRNLRQLYYLVQNQYIKDLMKKEKFNG